MFMSRLLFLFDLYPVADPLKVRNIIVSKILEELRRAGVACTPLLIQAGLTAYQVNLQDGWVPFEEHARLLEGAAAELQDPFLGLRLASQIDPRDYGAIGYVGLFSKNLGDALVNYERYLKVQTEAWDFDLTTDDTVAVLQMQPLCGSFNDHRQAADAAIATLIHAYQFFLGQPLAPLEVHLVQSVPSEIDKTHYNEVLNCPVKLLQNQTQIILDRETLTRPIGTADDRLLNILKSHCELVLEQHPPLRSDLASSIKETILRLMPRGQAKAKLVAREIGVSERTMHRHLADEGTSFSEIHASLRRVLAQKYIAEQDLSLQQIAFLLGYGDQSAFSVAFKRWTGLSPKQMRTRS